MTPRPYVRPLAQACVAAQILFIMGWLVLGAVEGHGYDPLQHDISDLGAVTAHHATAYRLLMLVTGAVTMAFGLFVVRPVLRSPAAGVLVALSLPALDNFTDGFFQVDCRMADPACTGMDAYSSWHGVAHVVSFAVAALATVGAPFVVAHAMNRLEEWRSMARPTRWFGALTVVLLIVAMLASGTAVQGLAQRLAATVITLGLAAFAVVVVEHEPRVSRMAQMIGGR